MIMDKKFVGTTIPRRMPYIQIHYRPLPTWVR
ncbi:hypothetical protein LINPERPRIM_LOCUS33008 [Linum perenne]